MLLLTAASRRTKAREEGVRHRLRPISRRMVRPQCSAAQKVNHHVVPIDQDKLSHTTTGLKDPVVSSPPVAFRHSNTKRETTHPEPWLLPCVPLLSASTPARHRLDGGLLLAPIESVPRPQRHCTRLPVAPALCHRRKRRSCPTGNPSRPQGFPSRGHTETAHGGCSCRDAAVRLASRPRRSAA